MHSKTDFCFAEIGSGIRMKNILITGGAGFIGRHLTSFLQRQGCKVRWLDCLDSQIHGDAASHDPAYCRDADDMIFGDVRRREDWVKALQDMEAVMHIAGSNWNGPIHVSHSVLQRCKHLRHRLALGHLIRAFELCEKSHNSVITRNLW